MLRRTKGFTLIEILIAMLILAIIGVILVSGLTSVLKTKDRVNAVSAHLAETQIAMSVISNDLRQVVNRNITDTNGDQLLPFFTYNRNGTVLEFTRTGFANPQSLELRSTLQRVTYSLQNNTLERGTWQVLDRAPSSVVTYTPLLTNVAQIKWAFLGPSNGMFYEWPSQNMSAFVPIPQGIQITLTFEDGSVIQRWFVVENYQPPQFSFPQMPSIALSGPPQPGAPTNAQP